MLVTISGGAGAGKSTLAAALARRWAGARVLHLDDYYFTERERPRGVWITDGSGTPRLDVGDPRSVDFARLDADAAAAGEHGVVVEGMFAFRVGVAAKPGARFDVFADLPADLRLARKIRRQCVDGDLPVEVLLDNYVRYRRAAHERHVEPARQIADLVVGTETPAEELAERIRAAITRGPGGRTATTPRPGGRTATTPGPGGRTATTPGPGGGAAITPGTGGAASAAGRRGRGRSSP